MEDNKPCPCRNMSERISHEEIERLQDEIDGAYKHQENEFELASKTILSQMEDFFKQIATALENVEVTNRRAIHEITGHADSNGYEFGYIKPASVRCVRALNNLYDAINFLEDCYNNKEFPIGHQTFDVAIISIRESVYCGVSKSKKIQTMIDELNKMTIKDQQKIYEFMEALKNEQVYLLERFVKERMETNGK